MPLIDRDVGFAQKWFGGTVADGRLSDSQLAEEGWRADSTIVTGNGPDLVKCFLEYQRKHPCTKSSCHDMSGLIVIPNHEFKALNALDAVERRGLRAGDTYIGLDEVHEYNLYVKYHADGSAELKRFPLCRYRANLSDMPVWYQNLKVVGGAPG